jgi:hypothetical protein
MNQKMQNEVYGEPFVTDTGVVKDEGSKHGEVVDMDEIHILQRSRTTIEFGKV